MKGIKKRNDKLIGDFDGTDRFTSSADQVQRENVFDSPTTDSQVLVAQEPEDADTDYLKDLESASPLLATSSPLPNASMPGPPEWCSRFPSSPFVGASTPNSAEKTNLLSYEFNERRPILEENYFELPGGTFTPLYPSCRIGSNNAQVLIRAFTNHHKISDACQVDLLKLLETIMPNPKLLPSAFKRLQSIELNLKDLTAKLITAAESQTCVLKFAELLKDIVQRNILSIIKYNISRCRDEVSDMPVELLQIAEQLDEFCNDLILSTDGVTFVSSSANHQMYPIWFSVAQLPPILPMSKKNIALAALFVGKRKPN